MNKSEIKIIKRNEGFLTPGSTCDAATSLSQTGAVHHHPSLVRLLPHLPNNIGCSRRVVIATLSCKEQTLAEIFLLICLGINPCIRNTLNPTKHE